MLLSFGVYAFRLSSSSGQMLGSLRYASSQTVLCLSHLNSRFHYSRLDLSELFLYNEFGG